MYFKFKLTVGYRLAGTVQFHCLWSFLLFRFNALPSNSWKVDNIIFYFAVTSPKWLTALKILVWLKDGVCTWSRNFRVSFRLGERFAPRTLWPCWYAVSDTFCSLWCVLSAENFSVVYVCVCFWNPASTSVKTAPFTIKVQSLLPSLAAVFTSRKWPQIP